MKLGDNVDISRLIPQFMREDKTFQGFMYALEQELKLIYHDIDTIKLYVNLDNLDEKILDELAWQFNIPEYDLSYDIPIKRDLIRNCFAIHHRRGTVAAVEEVISKIFGNAEIEEWFEYGGRPYYFKIRTTNIEATDEMIAQVTKAIRTVQNIRSHLDEVIIEVMQSMNIYYASVLNVVEFIDLKVMDY